MKFEDIREPCAECFYEPSCRIKHPEEYPISFLEHSSTCEELNEYRTYCDKLNKYRTYIKGTRA